MASVISQEIIRWREAALLLLKRRVPWIVHASNGKAAAGPGGSFLTYRQCSIRTGTNVRKVSVY